MSIRHQSKLVCFSILISMFMAVLSLTDRPSLAQNYKTLPPEPVATSLTLACAGYIGDTPASEDIQIAGSSREAITDEFAQNDTVYLSKGVNGNLKIGNQYQIIRNVGPIKNPKNPNQILGTLIYEVGILEVKELKETSAIAEITTSCNSIYLGDCIIPYEKKIAPIARPYKPLNTTATTTGRASGQILASTFNHEQLAQNDIVYVDLGIDNGVKTGDYLTIYRTAGSDSVSHFSDDRIGPKRSNGFPSTRFNTRDNTSLASNKKSKPLVIKETPRDNLPKTIIGEAVVVRTFAKTATCIITRTTREATIGDFIELQ